VISWVIGRGGLLGGSVEVALREQGAVWHPRHSFSWNDPLEIADQLSAACRAFAMEVGDSAWQIAWCAGTGVVASGPSDLERETLALRGLLRNVTETLSGRGRSRGAFFLASSAGGVYAGVGSPPYCETSPVAPLAPYGWNKLEQESLACEWSKETSTPLLIGRLSNLYGPGQNLTKAQGLITQICVRVVARQSLVLYVPLDTIRDYLFAADAGQMVADGLARLRLEAAQSGGTPAVVKILASQQPATVSTILAQLRWVTKRPASISVAASPNTARQARDLRLVSIVWPELDERPLTPLGAGMRAVLSHILEIAGEGRLEIDSLRVR
jgi:UDP-glucose 4-epimerase